MSSGGSLNLVMILGSVRQGRMVERVEKYVAQFVKKYSPSVELMTLDPLIVDSSNELNRQPLHFAKASQSPPWMSKMNETVKKSNALLVLSTEYNGLMPPALLNLMNSIPPSSFRHKPAGIVAYSSGNTGAMRALNVTRPYLSELGMLVVPGYVSIPAVHENINSDGLCGNKLVDENMRKLVQNLEWYARAIVNHHRNGNEFVD